MKRFYVNTEDFDGRATYLALEIKEEWDEEVKSLHRQNHQQILNELIFDFGQADAEQKITNFIELGGKAFSVISYHNNFAHQARRAFVIGSYYPALTGACALGERILNQLVINLRGDFQSTPEYQRLDRGNSFNKWNLMIRALEAWGILLPEVAESFDRFANVRNTAIHYQRETDTKARQQALKALQLLNGIIAKQFGILGNQPWYIPGIRGGAFIKKDFEAHPFVRQILIL